MPAITTTSLLMATVVCTKAVDAMFATVSIVVMQTVTEQIIAVVLSKTAQDHVGVIRDGWCTCCLTRARGRLNLQFVD